MDVKTDIEIKDEELDLEYNSYQQDILIFPDSGTDFASSYNIKNEELDEESSIKSELREIKKESMSDEEKVNNDVLKSEMSGKKLSFQHVKILPDSETEFAFASSYNIKNEELNEGSSVKSLSEIKKESTSDEEQSFIGVADQDEQSSKLKSCRSRFLTSLPFDEALKKNSSDYLRCRFCNFTFKNKDELTSHLKTHDKRKFKCAHCSYECNHKGHLNSHLLTHSNLKSFKCFECSYECNRKSDLCRHLLIHSNLKLFKCSECSYECNRKGDLNRHLLTHSNLKLFKCSECSYECNQKVQLKTHLLTHRNLKLFKCSECSYECNWKSHLKRHLLTHRKKSK